MPTEGMAGAVETPAELLANNVVLNSLQLAVALGLGHSRGAVKGLPDRQRARDLIRSGALQVVDPSQPPNRWTVSVVEVQRYLAEGPRRAGAA